jgi:serine/threonine protein kinase
MSEVPLYAQVAHRDLKLENVMHTLSHTHAHYHTPSHTLTHSHTHSHSHTLPHTLTHPHTPSHTQVAHRDLKLENVMLASPEEGAQVKLIDFGFCKVTRVPPWDPTVGVCLGPYGGPRGGGCFL